ncbi:MAG: site-2 protease family protein [Actinomycetota bacterium]|nr:site-2 protease family protein [Actinomycetota bacterium]MDD5667878.1 site-2 protease family protein [Actinomycetota bacterium]
MSDWERALYMLVGLIIGVIVHEYMHGYVAYRMGDTTAKRAGRLTLDPLAHIDPFGTLILPGLLLLMSIMGYGTFIIGYAKPVPINPFLFRKPRGIIWVSLAGPLSNLVLGMIFIGLIRILVLIDGGATLDRIILTCVFIAYINILLCVFNLIPIPPLDGSRIVGYFLRGEVKRVYASMEPYGFVIVIVLVMFFGFVLSSIVGGLANLIMRLFGLSPIF